MTVRVGIIGAGIMGADHAAILHRSVSGASVVAVTDPLKDRALAVARDTGAAVFETAADLIADASVDAVLIASHDSVHAEQVRLCLEYRKPVLCEKPLAPTAAECADLVLLQQSLDLDVPLISVGFMRRFHPAYRALKKHITGGTIGQPLFIQASHRNVRSYPDGNSASTITSSAVHEIDITSWLLDSPIEAVSWYAPRSTSADTARQDPQLLHLRTADGVLTSVDVFLNARYGYDVRCEVVGESGAVRLAPLRPVTIDRALTSGEEHAEDWRSVFAEAYRLQSQAWIDAVSSGRVPELATAEEAAQTALVAEALITSMNHGSQTVHVRHHTRPQAPGTVPAAAEYERTPNHVL